MLIIQEQRLRNKYKGMPRKLSDITEITLHASGGGMSSLALIDWMSSPLCERAVYYSEAIGLFPYTVNYDGSIYQIMPVEDWYYHSDAGVHDKHTIAIEAMNPGQNNSGQFTEAENSGLLELVLFLIHQYPITDIHSHDANRRLFSNLPPKQCPGFNFNWDNIEKGIKKSVERKINIIRS